MLATLWLVLVSACQENAPTYRADFRGIVLGSHIDSIGCEFEFHPRASEHFAEILSVMDKSVAVYTRKDESLVMGNVELSGVIYYFWKDRLMGIGVHCKTFDDGSILAALKLKYGDDYHTSTFKDDDNVTLTKFTWITPGRCVVNFLGSAETLMFRELQYHDDSLEEALDKATEANRAAMQEEDTAKDFEDFFREN